MNANNNRKMIAEKTQKTQVQATGLVDRLEGAKDIAALYSGALTAGGKAYVKGLLELARTLGGFGEELVADAGIHVRQTVEARSLREVGELQMAYAQHRVETSTAHFKEFVGLARDKTEEVIAPITVLLKQLKAA